jgi:hypothetical protein
MTQQVVHGALSPTTSGGSMPNEGRWGWYRDHEGREWRRVSTLVKKVETDTRALDLWKLRQVAEGLAIRDDLVLAVKAMGRPDPASGWSKDEKKKIDGIAEEASAAAKQRNGARSGTAFHDLTERLDRGEPVEEVVAGLPEAAARTLRAYAFMRQANEWRNIQIERTVVCDEVEAAGTFDRIEEIAGLTALLGPWVCQHGHTHTEESQVIADVKTEAAPWMNGLHIGPQLGIYSRARRMWVPTGGRVPLYWSDSGKPRMGSDGTQLTAAAGEYVPTPCVRQDVGVVVHLLDGDAMPYFVNLIEGWEGAVAAYEQQRREVRAGRKLGAAGAWFVAMPNVKRLPGPSAAEMATAAAQLADARGGQHCLVCREAVSGGQVNCRKCGHPVGRPGAEQVATTRADGMVDWQPAPAAEPAVENVATAGVLDQIDRDAIAAIWQAPELAHLAKTFEIYTQQLGRTWAGRVADAGEARRRQIECPQRQLHNGGGKCACGWVAGVAA